MRIYIATVSHKHGVNTYAAKSEVGINRQLADYARENWALENVPGNYEGLSDAQVIVEYFDYVIDSAGESYDSGPCELED